jgi:hypothetical protein
MTAMSKPKRPETAITAKMSEKRGETASTEGVQADRGRTVKLLAAGAATLLLVSICVLQFRSPLPATNPSSASPGAAGEATLDAVLRPLAKASDLATYRSALQQYNAELARFPEQRPPGLTEAEQAFLRQQVQLDEDEINEVAGGTFTLLDAHHLDACLLFHDVTETYLKGCAEESRPAAAFAWAMRQVRLVENDDEPAPAAAVLRRGWGNDRERTLVFLALLEQLNVPGCIIILPARPWACGVLRGGEVQLFDARLGVPLPGPNGRGVATLAQVRSQPDVVHQLSPLQYDVTPEQARRADVYLACSLSASAPRMRHLQKLLANSSGVQLGHDLPELARNFQQAERGLAGASVRLGGKPAPAGAPTRVLRAFLPPEEGGADRTREKQRRFNGTLIPWTLLPAQIEDVSEQVELGMRLRTAFAKPFLDFALNPQQPRERMLHGRIDDAIKGLVETRERWQQLQTVLRGDRELEQSFAKWFQVAVKAQADLLGARRKFAERGTPELREALDKAEAQMKRVWEDSPKPLQFVIGSAAGPLSAEATYLLAVAKHEQAELAEARKRQSKTAAELEKEARAAWQAASDWWQKYLDDNASAPAATAARLNRARALEALGDYHSAIGVLQAGVGQAEGWSKRALQYRISQIQRR